MNVYEAAQKRLRFIFDEFDNVLVAFSGGKDSGVCLNMCYDYAKETGQLNKLAVYNEDYEAGYPHTFEFIERIFDSMPQIKRFWLCLPINAACSVSMHQTSWIPWNPEEKEIWVRKVPSNIWFPFKKGTSGFDLRIIFANEFAKKYGKTAVIIGLRMDESLSRRSIITSSMRVNFYKDKKYSVVNNVSDTVNFYPIYDWKTDDVWIANYKFKWDYNKLYDLYYRAGLNAPEMRTASPFHAAGQNHLKLYKVICPTMWGKMVSRVNGVNFTCIYGGTIAMGWKNIKKPLHFTWKQYMEFLLSTLPDDIRKKYETKIEKSKWHWRVQGGARSKEFIEHLEKEGVDLIRSGKKSAYCKVNTDKEIIYINDWFDDTNVDDFKKAPTYKRACIAIMKNDTQCLFMGFSRTKEDMDRRKNIMEKYKALL
jgi:predicted phosphoadenosine phosphosulfate sulfurtransferase